MCRLVLPDALTPTPREQRAAPPLRLRRPTHACLTHGIAAQRAHMALHLLGRRTADGGHHSACGPPLSFSPNIRARTLLRLLNQLLPIKAAGSCLPLQERLRPAYKTKMAA
jgi:hypothetical protein